VTSDQRVQALPDVPTMSEAFLPRFNSISWLGLLAPSGTPSEVVQKVADDVQALMSLDEVKARFVDLGAVPTGLGSVQFSTLIETDRVRYEKIIRDRKISAN